MYTIFQFMSFLSVPVPIVSSNPLCDDHDQDSLESNVPDQYTVKPTTPQYVIMISKCLTSQAQASSGEITTSAASISSPTSPKQSPSPSLSIVPSSSTTNDRNPPASGSQQGLHVEANQSLRRQPFHPIIETLRQQELGRHILLLAVPMTIGLFSLYNPVNAPVALPVMAVALALGFTGIWNGILLRTTCYDASNIIELIGIAFMLLAFFGFIACFLPDSLIWIPFLCWFLSVVLVLVALCFRGRTNKEGESLQDSSKNSLQQGLEV